MGVVASSLFLSLRPTKGDRAAGNAMAVERPKPQPHPERNPRLRRRYLKRKGEVYDDARNASYVAGAFTAPRA